MRSMSNRLVGNPCFCPGSCNQCFRSSITIQRDRDNVICSQIEAHKINFITSWNCFASSSVTLIAVSFHQPAFTISTSNRPTSVRILSTNFERLTSEVISHTATIICLHDNLLNLINYHSQSRSVSISEYKSADTRCCVNVTDMSSDSSTCFNDADGKWGGKVGLGRVDSVVRNLVKSRCDLPACVIRERSSHDIDVRSETWLSAD